MSIKEEIFPRRAVKSPEVMNPNEPGWNGRLLSMGSGIFVVLAFVVALWWAFSHF